jgi:hypothetical protein
MAILLALLTLTAFAKSHKPPEPQPQSKSSQLPEDNGAPQPAPSINFPTPQQITEAIASGIERSEKKHEENHPAPPPDNISWWLNFFLVIFTGGLVVVGAAQCYLIFRTLKATEVAANAANLSAQAAIGVELPKLMVSSIGFQEVEVPDRPIAHKVIVTVTNYGRTPAFVSRETAEMRFTPTLPPAPDYRNSLDLMPCRVVSNLATYDIIACLPDQSTIIDYQCFKNSNKKIWIYGCIMYRDFLDRPHNLDFCARLYFPIGLAETCPQDLSSADVQMSIQKAPIINRVISKRTFTRRI